MSTVNNYVFAYGSLMQTASRRRNLRSESAPLPARLHGWRRGWNVRGPGVGFVGTFLGANEERDATMNGVLAPVAEDEWSGLDRRESDYRLVTLDREPIELLGEEPPSLRADATVFLYVTKKVAPPSREAPIVQSYLDICLSGCLETDAQLGADEVFAKEFIRSTADWSVSWVNDRVHPRAAFRTNPEAIAIDRLLQAALPTEFAAIRIE